MLDLDEKNLSKKEMNYSLIFENFLNLSLIYNETQSEAFKIFLMILNLLVRYYQKKLMIM